jgi:hypothetical protein
MCPRCGGQGIVPLKDARPFVWVEGTAPLKPEAAVGEQYCPACRPLVDPGRWAGEVRERIEAAQARHEKWRERIGGRLILALTRHGAISTQLTAAQARTVAVAVENLSLHLRGVTGSLALTPTWPDNYALIYLWEKPAWDHFRTVMEAAYTREQLGEQWPTVRDYHSYDHFETPHLYATAQSLRQRPLSYGALFLFAHRQINLATDWQAPTWLAEGFAAYGEHAVLGDVRWFSVYDSSRSPVPGDWLREARGAAAGGKLHPWAEHLPRALRDYDAVDYCQSLALVAFLLHSDSRRFLDFCRRLKAREACEGALAAAYQQPLPDLELEASRWLLARK